MIRETAGIEGERWERFRSVAEAVQSHAAKRPDERCITFLDGEEELATATWRELDRAARARAVSLRKSVPPGSRIVLVYRSEQHFAAAFLGCLYAGMVPVPLSAPHRTRPAQLSRFVQVVEDARPAMTLSESGIVELAEALPRTTDVARRLQWAVAEWAEGADGEDFTPVRSQPEETAFIQYTSGSTSTPKGVLVSHANLLANVRMLAESFRLTAEDTWVSWLPLFHDMGLILHLLTPWVIGGHAVLMSPLAFLQRPMRWMEAVSRYRGTISTAPNFAYALATKRSTPEQRAQVDLSSWTRVLCGAEPIRADTLRSFAEAFSGSGMKWEHYFPCYGLAEGTLVVSGSKRRREAPVVLEVRRSALEAGRVEAAGPAGDTQELVASGEVSVETEAVIVHPELRELCPPDMVGEIWLSGTAVGGGYWQRTEESAKVFGARLVGGGGPYLRTGDLGFIRDGALFITGRLKDLIIIRGRNLYPQDVGDVVEAAHPNLRAGSCSSFGVSVEGEERLVVAVEADFRSPERRATPGDDGTPALEKSLDELRKTVRSAVVEAFDVLPHAVVLLKVGRTLKTSSGKLQHRLMRQAYLAGELEELSAP